MGLKRVKCFFEELRLKETESASVSELAEEYSAKSRGMMHFEDLKALGAALMTRRPATLFEIGTFRGNTSDFCMNLLPSLKVVSIAHVAPILPFLGKKYNNSHTSRDEIGCEVSAANRPRFTQLYGDSHTLDAKKLKADFGAFDMVFIDGDHSGTGVALDTVLASRLLNPDGAICWHDANPKEKYRDVREFLESRLPVDAVATKDDFVGGIAFWSGDPRKLTSLKI